MTSYIPVSSDWRRDRSFWNGGLSEPFLLKLPEEHSDIWRVWNGDKEGRAVYVDKRGNKYAHAFKIDYFGAVEPRVPSALG